MSAGELAGRCQCLSEHLLRRRPAGAFHGQPGRHPPDPACHPDHEVLIQVAGEDGQEACSLEEGGGLVLG